MYIHMYIYIYRYPHSIIDFLIRLHVLAYRNLLSSKCVEGCHICVH